MTPRLVPVPSLTPQTERNLDAANEVIADHAATIGKFRELVQRLQDQNTDLRAQLEKETNKPVGVPAEKIDFKVGYLRWWTPMWVSREGSG